MELAFIAGVIALIASFATIKIIKPIAVKVGLVDVPNHRKIHKGNVPLIGGISVFIGVLTSTTIILPQSSTLNLYLISSALIVFVGTLDDFKELSVGARITAQTLVATIMVYGAGLHLESLGNILSLGEIQLGLIGYPLTILAVLAAINAFNMSDGIDGLAGSLSLVSFLSVGIFLLLNGSSFVLLPFVLAVSTLPFLFFNIGLFKRTKKIFMGDAGSMFVGLSIVWLLVIGSQGDELAFRPVTALWIIAVPFMDMCAITIRRLSHGRSPFIADKEHLHHIFLRMGFTSGQALLTIIVMSVCFAAIGIFGELYQVPEWFMFLLFCICFVTYFWCLIHAWHVTKLVKKFRSY